MIFSMILYMVFILIGDKIFSIAYNNRYDHVISNNLIFIVLTIIGFNPRYAYYTYILWCMLMQIQHQLSIYFKEVTAAIICFIYTIFFYFFHIIRIRRLMANISIVVLPVFGFIKLLSLIVLFFNSTY